MRSIHRVRSALQAALLFVAAGASPLPAQGASGQKSTIAVMYFNNSAMVRRNEFEPLRKGITDILITELQVNPSVQIVERDRLQSLLEEQNLDTTSRVDQETAARIGRILGVQHMIMGGFVVDPSGAMRLDARAVNVETSKVVYGETISGKSENILTLVADLAGKMNRGLRLPEIPVRPRPAPRGGADGARRLQAILLYGRAIEEEDSRNPQNAARFYREFLQKCPEADAPDQRRIAMQRIRDLESR
jgi:TolB-like protein